MSDSRVEVKQHLWVKHVITPVEVLDPLEDNDPPVVVVDPDQERIAEDHAAYGCLNCGVPLAGHYGSNCVQEEE